MESKIDRFYPTPGRDINSSNSYYSQRPELVTTRKLTKTTGSLEIIGGEGSEQFKTNEISPSNSRPSSSTSTRSWSRSSVGSVPPRPDSSVSRRMNTPTKQISLQAVRRKEESSEPFIDQVDWQSLGQEENHTKTRELRTDSAVTEPKNALEHPDSFRLEPVVETSQHATKLSLLKPDNVKKEDAPPIKQHFDSDSGKASHSKEMSGEDKNRDEKKIEDDDGSDESDESDSSDEDEEKLRAPNELLMEFVDSLMRKEYQTASKLCKMILLYEPENPEAVKFQPLIEERLALDAEAEKEEDCNDDGSEDDSSDEDEEDDDSSDDNSDDEDSSSSDDDLSDEEDEDNVRVAAVKETCVNNDNNNNVHFGSHSQTCYYRD